MRIALDFPVAPCVKLANRKKSWRGEADSIFGPQGLSWRCAFQSWRVSEGGSSQHKMGFFPEVHCLVNTIKSWLIVIRNLVMEIGFQEKNTFDIRLHVDDANSWQS